MMSGSRDEFTGVEGIQASLVLVVREDLFQVGLVSPQSSIFTGR